MVRFTRSDELQGAAFVGVDLRGARFVESDLSDVVMRGVELRDADLDAPWLPFAGTFRVNGVDVIAFVEAELDGRFPGRGLRRAADPDGLREAWAALEARWEAVVARVEAMPAGTVDVRVDGEWSFAETLRHLVLATDAWLGRGVLELEQPFHPLGLAFAGATPDDATSDPSTGDGAADGALDLSALTPGTPPWAEVLAARADRVARVRSFLAAVTAEELDAPRRNPWDPAAPETTRSCLHVVLEEEWEHHRFAVRDLDALAGTSA